MQEITAPFAAVKEQADADPGEPDFPHVLRGYDRVAVDAYIAQSRQLIADLRSISSPEAAVRRALERVGEEVSAILQRAHDTADKITTHSRSEAEERLMAARDEAGRLKAEAERELEVARRDGAEIRARAEQQLTELDAETDRIWAERHRIVEDARELASQLLALAESAAARFPPAEETAETLPPAAEAEPGQDVPTPAGGAEGADPGLGGPDDDMGSTVIMPRPRD